MMVAGPVRAQASFPEKQFGAWKVYGLFGDCWMVREDAGSGDVSLSTTPGDTDLYVSLQNPRWDWIGEGATIDVRIEFGGFDRVLAADALPITGKGVSLFLGGADDSYVHALKAAPILRFTLRPGNAIELPLASAGAAFDYFQACTASIRKP